MPIVIVTPWINKFYILDLTAKKSMVKYLTDQGFSVFITSWKNPGEDMAHVRFDDYLLEGVNEVVRVASEFCKQPKVHLVGYCIGGTLVSTYMAWANKRFGKEQMPVAHWTLFTTLTDFSHPGDIDVFIDEACIGALEESMAKKGYLDGNDMAGSFRMLRSNPLIWHYWEHSYLLGEPLPPFDVLFWNVDSTRMPQAMHSYYLREMYLNNNLIKRDKLTIAGESIDLDDIVQPLYAVTAEDDHIAPWKQCYRIRKYINVEAPVRFVLFDLRPHPRHRQSAGQSAQARLLDRGAGAQRALGTLVRTGREKARFLVGGLDGLARRTDRRTGRSLSGRQSQVPVAGCRTRHLRARKVKRREHGGLVVAGLTWYIAA